MVDKKSNIPYYIQIKEDLLAKINSGLYKTGAKIPTEIELSSLYEVSRITVREAIKELISENRIEVFKGRGMYVKPYTLTPLEGVEKIASFSSLLSNKGLNFSIEVLELKKLDARPDIAANMGISKKSPIVFLKRVRAIENKPAVLTYAYFKYEICAELLNIDIGKKGLFHSIEKILGIKIKYLKRIIEPALSSSYQSRMLKIKDRSPVIYMRSFLYMEKKSLFGYIEDYFMKDFARFEFDLSY